MTADRRKLSEYRSAASRGAIDARRADVSALAATMPRSTPYPEPRLSRRRPDYASIVTGYRSVFGT